MVYTVYKGVCLGLGAVAADFHDTSQAVDKEIAFLCVIAYLSPHFEDTAQRVKTILDALIESPYTTPYQTVRTGNGLNWSEVA